MRDLTKDLNWINQYNIKMINTSIATEWLERAIKAEGENEQTQEAITKLGEMNYMIEFYPTRINPTDDRISWVCWIGFRDAKQRFAGESKDINIALIKAATKAIADYEAKEGEESNEN